MQPSVLTAEDLQERLAEAFPEAFHPDSGLAILGRLANGVDEAHLSHWVRPPNFRDQTMDMLDWLCGL